MYHLENPTINDKTIPVTVDYRPESLKFVLKEILNKTDVASYLSLPKGWGIELIPI